VSCPDLCLCLVQLTIAIASSAAVRAADTRALVRAVLPLTLLPCQARPHRKQVVLLSPPHPALLLLSAAHPRCKLTAVLLNPLGMQFLLEVLLSLP